LPSPSACGMLVRLIVGLYYASFYSKPCTAISAFQEG